MKDWRAVFLENSASTRTEAGTSFSSLTTWGIGGPADLLSRPRSAEEAASVLERARTQGVPATVVGWGSNLLVSDRGVRGVVLRPSACFGPPVFFGGEVTGGPGIRLPALARDCATRGLAGLEFAAGIPGSLGGAVAVNAGAEGSEMAAVVASVRVLRVDGREESLPGAALAFSYRSSRLLEEPAFVSSVTLVLREGDPRSVRSLTRENLGKRVRQPRGRSAGSVFRNPPGGFAGRMLESVGAKGLRSGAAEVSEVHANFIMNRGGAEARDVLDLMRMLQRRVRDETGILLEPEVMFAGFDPDDPDLPEGARCVRSLS